MTHISTKIHSQTICLLLTYALDMLQGNSCSEIKIENLSVVTAFSQKVEYCVLSYEAGSPLELKYVTLLKNRTC